MAENTMTRRGFAAALGAAAAAPGSGPRPNILWLTCEDIGPHIGAYGDRYADTPVIDRLASRGLRYRNAWSNAPVCAPARTTIISGLYPPSTGSEHMRSLTSLPPNFKMFPAYLREAGYYATNNSKEDYNLEHTGRVWDESSNRAHWRKRQPGQPFFSVVNFTITHESQIRRRPHTLVHDPARVRVPAYHPDTPEVRHDWAQYYDNITTMDGQAGKVLAELEQDGLAEDTIVFFYGDHGSGMPRNKRWPYDSGLRVPLIVHIPEKFRHLAPRDYRAGGASDRMVGFIDLAPTVLSLAGLRPPEWMQGGAFVGAHQAPEREFNYGFRGRMDERCDMVRSVCDRRYIYIRNYMPHKIYGQHLAYMFETPTTQVWHDLYHQGKLKPPRTHFWETKPPEELYDLQEDRDEVRNLARSPKHQQTLARLRKAQQELAVQIRDVGFLPEGEMHARSRGATPYQMGHDERRYPMKKIMETAEVASSLEGGAADELANRMKDPDSAVRYWATMGILMRGAEAVKGAAAPLRAALEDRSPEVRITAAETLGRYGGEDDLRRALAVLGGLAPPDRNGLYVSIMALNAIDTLGGKARPLCERIKSMPDVDPNSPQRTHNYVRRLVEWITRE